MIPYFTFLVVALVVSLPELVLCWEGKVVGVLDGDTIKVMCRGQAQEIRLFGVDCPEREQDFGYRAKRFTSEMAFGKIVEVAPVDADRYGRVVAWVTVGGKSLNKELLRLGMAWWYRRYAGQEIELRQLEEEARKNRLGLWSRPHPVPPWNFRRQKINDSSRDLGLLLDSTARPEYKQ